MLAAITLPLPIVLSYLPMLRAHAGGIYPRAFQPDANTIFEVYIAAIDRELIILCLAALLVLLLYGRSHLRAGTPDDGPPWFFSAPEWVALVGLLLSPLVLLGWLILTHGAFFTRYAAIANLGVVPARLGAARALDTFSRPTVAGRRCDRRGARPADLRPALCRSDRVCHNPPVPSFPGLRAPNPPSAKPAGSSARPSPGGAVLPLVAASGLIFLEMNHRESAPTPRSALLPHRSPRPARPWPMPTSSSAWTRSPRRSIFAATCSLIAPSSPSIQASMCSESNKYPEDWLLRQLLADGATLQLVRQFEPGAYRQTELYLVTYPDRTPVPSSSFTRSQP